MIIVSKDKFVDWLREKGYKEYTNDGLPSTILQYCYAIERVMEKEQIDSMSHLTFLVRYIINNYRNSISERKYWKTQFEETVRALEVFEWYLLETFPEYKRILGLK